MKTAHALKSLSRNAAPTSYINRQDALCNIRHHLHMEQTPPPYVLQTDLKCIPKSAAKHISGGNRVESKNVTFISNILKINVIDTLIPLS